MRPGDPSDTPSTEKTRPMFHVEGQERKATWTDEQTDLPTKGLALVERWWTAAYSLDQVGRLIKTLM